MDDEVIGADQARRLRAALTAADLELSRAWMHYFRLGGDASEMEIDAYLHHALALPGLQRDLLAHAVTELTDGHRIPPLPFTVDYHTPHSTIRPVKEDAPLARPPSDAEGREEKDANDEER